MTHREESSSRAPPPIFRFQAEGRVAEASRLGMRHRAALRPDDSDAAIGFLAGNLLLRDS